MIKVYMPSLSPTMTEGKIVQWLRVEGDIIKPGDALLAVETDKANVEYESEDEGTLGRIIVASGDSTITVGTLICILMEKNESVDLVDNFLKDYNNQKVDDSKVGATSGEKSNDTNLSIQNSIKDNAAHIDSAIHTENAAHTKNAAHAGTNTTVHTENDAHAGEHLLPGTGKQAPHVDSSAASNEDHNKVANTVPRKGDADLASIKDGCPIQSRQISRAKNSNDSDDSYTIASPLAKKISRESNINIDGIKGTGIRGMVSALDIYNSSKGKIDSDSNSSSQVSSGSNSNSKDTVGNNVQTNAGINETYIIEEPSNIRKIIAEKLTMAKNSIPHFYLNVKCNADKIIEAREDFNKLNGTRVTINDLFTKASAIALDKFPAMNSSWINNKIIRYRDVSIGIAMSINDNLYVPILRDLKNKSVLEVSISIKNIAQKISDNKISLEDLQAQSMTISNLGKFNIPSFNAILNPPNSCILAIGSSAKEPIISGSDIVIANIINLCLSVDHRIADGVVAANFMNEIKQLIEHPLCLFL